ncbi:ParA family protein [Brachybacterium paraconglomeratum]|uniref:ParA family protein n=1 Tax=Brachybacterium paraconglomeratum TaxID=173362 RepID=UPI003FD39A70
MAVYTCALPKGGSTKTSTAAEIALALARRGFRVLAIDLDQQGNLSTRLGITPETPIEATAAEVLDASATLREAAEPAPTAQGVDVIVGAHDLTSLEEQPPPDLVTSLRDMLPTVGDRWDHVVIDTPPNVGALTMAGLAAADHVIVSLQAATEAYDQLDRLEAVIAERLTRRIRPGLQISAVVPAMVDSRRLLDREILELLAQRYGDRVTPPVRQAVAVRDAYTAGMGVSVYDPDSAVAADYRAATDHLLNLTMGAH